eukprot:TRINITY_DN1321_c0_g1_i5.p1 TRINITY_DN1321_c0_g1~~TRINITY_DN1321_c0_g1_i5.p1  ORF type:complete len:284 (-),score=74.27 TRINITY_DN1321_c0_g1_i5:169-1020(-)
MKVATVFFALLAITTVSAGLCAECKLVIGAVEGYLESNSTVAEITADLEKACSQMPEFSFFCDELVDYGIPYILQLLENSESTDTVCQQLGFCSSKKPQKLIANVKVGESLQCEGCEYLVGAIESWVESKVSAKTIEKRLDTVCELIPGFASICEQYVKMGVPKLIAYIEQAENSTVVCQQLKVCTSSSPVFSPIKSLKSAECNACLTVFTEVLSELQSGSALPDVEKAILNGVCANAPNTFKATCDYVAQEGFDYINSKIQNATPQKICGHIRVCSSVPRLH